MITFRVKKMLPAIKQGANFIQGDLSIISVSNSRPIPAVFIIGTFIII